MKKRIIFIILSVSLLINLLGGFYLINKKNREVADYNRIYMHPIITKPNIAENVANIYFEDFLKRLDALDHKDEFYTTVMFDKDTYEWVVVYMPIIEEPAALSSNIPEDYSHEIRLRMDRGMVRNKSYDFLEYWY